MGAGGVPAPIKQKFNRFDLYRISGEATKEIEYWFTCVSVRM